MSTKKIYTRAEILELFASQVAYWLEHWPAEAGNIRQMVCEALRFNEEEYRNWLKKAVGVSAQPAAPARSHSSAVEFNLEAVNHSAAKVRGIVLVESRRAAIALTEKGFPAIAMLGPFPSPELCKLLRRQS